MGFHTLIRSLFHAESDAAKILDQSIALSHEITNNMTDAVVAATHTACFDRRRQCEAFRTERRTAP